MTIDIPALLADGDKRTVGNVNRVVELAIADPKQLVILIQCLAGPAEGANMRAADALQKIHSQNPDLLKDHTVELFNVFMSTDQKEVRWHMAQILPTLPLTPTRRKQAVEIWEHDFYHSPSSIVRTFSMQAVYDVRDHDEAFVRKLKKMLAHAHKHGTPAMKSRAQKLEAKL